MYIQNKKQIKVKHRIPQQFDYQNNQSLTQLKIMIKIVNRTLM